MNQMVYKVQKSNNTNIESANITNSSLCNLITPSFWDEENILCPELKFKISMRP